eukprot:Seg1749.5 transcript_id=Seg1749.5/GoldUCD/mRNA.D3Y31 product="hypothetical protein" protein_id=Seg1749.5/GoldUCD/D3Y31
MFTILLTVCFLLIIQVIRNSLTINGLLGKLRGFQDGVEATRRGAELTVNANDSRFQKDNLMEYGKKSSPNKDRNAVWNGNFKRVTTGSFKTDSLKVHPSKKVSQTSKSQEHKISIMKRITTESPKTNNLKVHPSKQVLQTTKKQEHDMKDLNIYPKNDGKYLGYGESNCKRGRSELIFAKLFEHWIKLAKREKIEYFLSCGTLLGAYRNGDLIPYDSDIDILVKQSDFLKIKKNSTMKPFSPDGKDIHVYVNKDFHKPLEKRRRFKCSGEVCICCFVAVLFWLFFILRLGLATSLSLLERKKEKEGRKETCPTETLPVHNQRDPYG